MKLDEKNLVYMSVFDRRMLAGTIATEYGNPTTAAKILGMSRQTLQGALEGSRVHINTALLFAYLLLKNAKDVNPEHVAEWEQVTEIALQIEYNRIVELDAILELDAKAKLVQSNVPGLQK